MIFSLYYLNSEYRKELLFNKVSSLDGCRLTLIEHYIKDLIDMNKIFKNNLVQINLLNKKINIIDTLRKVNDLELFIEEEFGVRLALLFESIFFFHLLGMYHLIL